MKKDSDTEAPQLSLCVGVTGHRDIAPASEVRVKELVEQVFDRLQSEFGLGLVVFSSLAEGADRMVAKIALDREARLIVPLPSPVEEYEQDFVTPESRREFHQLLSRAENHFVVDPASVAYEETGEDEAPRVLGYRRAGLFVAQSCHVLLALWDGIDHGSPAGTWEIVAAKQAGESPIGRPDPSQVRFERARGVVIQVRTPRASAPDAVKPALLWREMPNPDGDNDQPDTQRAWEALRKTGELTRRFNKDIAKHGADPGRLIAASSSARTMRQHPKEAPPGVDRLIELYAVADHLALLNQTLVRRSWIALYGAGVIAVVAYGLYAHIGHDQWPLLAAYLGAMFASYVAFFFVYRQAWHERFLDYRGLAEGLRVAFFWRVTGLPGDPVDRYPANLSGEVEWVRMVLRGETAAWEPREPKKPRTPATLAFAIKHWVGDQADYFERTRHRHSRSAKKGKQLSEYALLGGVAIAFLMLCVLIWRHSWLEQPTYGAIYAAMLVAIAAIPAVGAAISGYADRRGYEAQARQYERMADLFEHAQVVLASLKRDSDKRQVLAKLAGEALAEHAQWVVLHHERPFEFVAGGG